MSFSVALPDDADALDLHDIDMDAMFDESLASEHSSDESYASAHFLSSQHLAPGIVGPHDGHPVPAGLSQHYHYSYMYHGASPHHGLVSVPSSLPVGSSASSSSPWDNPSSQQQHHLHHHHLPQHLQPPPWNPYGGYHMPGGQQVPVGAGAHQWPVDPYQYNNSSGFGLSANNPSLLSAASTIQKAMRRKRSGKAAKSSLKVSVKQQKALLLLQNAVRKKVNTKRAAATIQKGLAGAMRKRKRREQATGGVSLPPSSNAAGLQAVGTGSAAMLYNPKFLGLSVSADGGGGGGGTPRSRTPRGGEMIMGGYSEQWDGTAAGFDGVDDQNFQFSAWPQDLPSTSTKLAKQFPILETLTSLATGYDTDKEYSRRFRKMTGSDKKGGELVGELFKALKVVRAQRAFLESQVELINQALPPDDDLVAMGDLNQPGALETSRIVKVWVKTGGVLVNGENGPLAALMRDATSGAADSAHLLAGTNNVALPLGKPPTGKKLGLVKSKLPSSFPPTLGSSSATSSSSSFLPPGGFSSSVASPKGKLGRPRSVNSVLNRPPPSGGGPLSTPHPPRLPLASRLSNYKAQFENELKILDEHMLKENEAFGVVPSSSAAALLLGGAGGKEKASSSTVDGGAGAQTVADPLQPRPSTATSTGLWKYMELAGYKRGAVDLGVVDDLVPIKAAPNHCVREIAMFLIDGGGSWRAPPPTAVVSGKASVATSPVDDVGGLGGGGPSAPASLFDRLSHLLVNVDKESVLVPLPPKDVSKDVLESAVSAELSSVGFLQPSGTAPVLVVDEIRRLQSMLDELEADIAMRSLQLRANVARLAPEQAAAALAATQREAVDARYREYLRQKQKAKDEENARKEAERKRAAAMQAKDAAASGAVSAAAAAVDVPALNAFLPW